MKPATLLIPTDHILMLLVKEFYGTRYHSGSFCLVNVGSGFHCLRNFFFFLFPRIVHAVCGMWYVVCGMWYVVCGVWYVVCSM